MHHSAIPTEKRCAMKNCSLVAGREVSAPLSILIGIALFAAADICRAQSATEPASNSVIPGLFIDTTTQPAVEPETAETGWKVPPQENRSPEKEPQPDQANTSQGWSPPAQGSESGYGSCKYATPEQEDFFCKMVRILYGPDTPRGPNRDVDENISAGGAGG